MMSLISTVAAIGLLYWLPGAALVESLWPGLRTDPRHDRLSRFAISAAASVALLPVLTLWCWTLDLPAGPGLAWGAGLLGAAVLLRNAWRRSHQPTAPHSRSGAGIEGVDLALAAVVTLVALSRWLTVRGLVAPAWGDSVQHTFITQLLLDNRGLFQSWAPYAPMESLTYHFGFHAMAASWAWITDSSATEAVIATGQIIGVLAVLALYPLALQITQGSRVAGLGTLLVAGLYSPFPAFYVNWGRYTQLAGQTILPVLVVLLDAICFDKQARRATRSGLLMLLLAGLGLTHYRIVGLAAAAGVCWPVAAAWFWRRSPGNWIVRCLELLAAAAGALLLISPWLAQLDQGLLLEVHKTIVGLSPEIFSLRDPLRAWSSLPANLPYAVAGAILGAGLLGTLRRDRAILLILFWSGVALITTNPFVLGLPGTGLVTNFALGIAAYIPGALLAGWLLARIYAWTGPRPTLRISLVSLLVITGLVGFTARASRVEPDFELLTPSDLRSFTWIEQNTPGTARFQVNATIGYGGKTAVGTDGGWWLPLFTRRSSTLPPLPYTMEVMHEKKRHDIWATPQWLFRAIITENSYHPVFCHQSVTHVFLGAKRGSVGGSGEALLPEALLRKDPAMTLLHEDGQSQVWEFDQERCS